MVNTVLTIRTNISPVFVLVVLDVTLILLTADYANIRLSLIKRITNSISF